MPKDKNPFAEWVERVFNIQPETIPYFYDQDRSLWSKEVAPEVTFAHMIELFEHPQPILEPFTDEQQKWGLYYIVANSPTQADYLSLEKSFQHRCIHSFDNLFKDFFEVKCWPDPFDMENRKSVNAACYRWWMEISFNCTPDN